MAWRRSTRCAASAACYPLLSQRRAVLRTPQQCVLVNLFSQRAAGNSRINFARIICLHGSLGNCNGLPSFDIDVLRGPRRLRCDPDCTATLALRVSATVMAMDPAHTDASQSSLGQDSLFVPDPRCVYLRVHTFRGDGQHSDTLRNELTPNAPPNTAEFGAVKTPEGFHGLYAGRPSTRRRRSLCGSSGIPTFGRSKRSLLRVGTRSLTLLIDVAIRQRPSLGTILQQDRR